MEVIYLDVLVGLNLSINYILLLVTGRLSGMSAKRWRLFAAAFFGALYAALIFLPTLKFFYTAPIKILFGALMVLISYGVMEKGKFLRLFLLFLTVSFAFGGCVTAVYYLAGAQCMKNGVFYLNVPLKIILLSIALAYALTGVIFYRGAKHSVEKSTERVIVELMGKKAEISLMVDSGNDLSDPVSGKPIMVLERKAFAKILPRELLFVPLEITKQNAAEILCKIGETPYQNRFRLVSYRALGTDGLLLVLKPDKITRQNGRKYDAMIAVSPNYIAGGEFEGLISV